MLNDILKVTDPVSDRAGVLTPLCITPGNPSARCRGDGQTEATAHSQPWGNRGLQ